MLGFGKPASIAAGVLFGGAAIKGFYDQVAPKTIDNAMDIAFGDPQADRAVLGTDLTPSLMVAGVGGIRGLDPAVRAGGAVAVGGAGAALGAAAGSLLSKKTGSKVGMKIGAALGGLAGGVAGSLLTSNNIARQMNYDKFGYDTGGAAVAGAGMAGAAVGAVGGVYAGAKFGGVKGAIAGGVAGLIGGATAGTAAAAVPTISTARNNRQIMTESPFYNQSLLTAERLNASGNIVLRNA